MKPTRALYTSLEIQESDSCESSLLVRSPVPQRHVYTYNSISIRLSPISIFERQ